MDRARLGPFNSHQGNFLHHPNSSDKGVNAKVGKQRAFIRPLSTYSVRKQRFLQSNKLRFTKVLLKNIDKEVTEIRKTYALFQQVTFSVRANLTLQSEAHLKQLEKLSFQFCRRKDLIQIAKKSLHRPEIISELKEVKQHSKKVVRKMREEYDRASQSCVKLWNLFERDIQWLRIKYEEFQQASLVARTTEFDFTDRADIHMTRFIYMRQSFAERLCAYPELNSYLSQMQETLEKVTGEMNGLGSQKDIKKDAPPLWKFHYDLATNEKYFMPDHSHLLGSNLSLYYEKIDLLRKKRFNFYTGEHVLCDILRGKKSLDQVAFEQDDYQLSWIQGWFKHGQSWWRFDSAENVQSTIQGQRRIIQSFNQQIAAWGYESFKFCTAEEQRQLGCSEKDIRENNIILFYHKKVVQA